MQKLNVIAAGLGWSVIERNGAKRMCGLNFEPAQSVFPALTCVAQASLRTGLTPAKHGMVANGMWFEDLQKPMFWEQSSKLVKGPRIWAEQRAAGHKVGLFFFQQSLGEDVDAIISPAPIHKHSGGMIMSCYIKPSNIAKELERKVGKFPLHRYWGPLASPKVGRACIEWFKAFIDICDIEEAWLYLPTLDYAAQRSGPGSKADMAAFAELKKQLECLADFCSSYGASMSVMGDYDITPVTLPPLTPNVTLREKGFFATRMVGNMAYPDFYSSSAFAMCDHEVCFVYGSQKDEAAESLLSTGLYCQCTDAADGLPNNCRTLIARQGSWCSYEWWVSRHEAPDWANHVDIHNKPGYDPKELFFFGRGIVKGTHGRRTLVAKTE